VHILSYHSQADELLDFFIPLNYFIMISVAENEGSVWINIIESLKVRVNARLLYCCEWWLRLIRRYIWLYREDKWFVISIIKMKSTPIFNQLPSATSKKYIPSPESAELILNYFIYNNFQDFNTWQQIAKTKVEYEYSETNKSLFGCRVTLKW
jgi:hypothetical protein